MIRGNKMKFKLYIEPVDLPVITKYYSGQIDKLNVPPG